MCVTVTFTSFVALTSKNFQVKVRILAKLALCEVTKSLQYLSQISGNTISQVFAPPPLAIPNVKALTRLYGAFTAALALSNSTLLAQKVQFSREV